MKELYLVRHGETAGQSSIRFYGSTDIALSDLGRQQMQCVSGAIAHIGFRSIITSPLIRARESTSLAHPNPEPVPKIVEGFREIDFGDVEGMTKNEILARYGGSGDTWDDIRSRDSFPGGEKKSEFYSRIAEAATEVVPGLEYPALAVLHKGVMRGVLSSLTGIPVEDLMAYNIELGSIHRLEHNGDGWRVTGANMTDHLDGCRIEHS